MINKIQPSVHQLHFKEFGSTVYLIQIDNQNILIDTSSKENQQELLNDLKQLNLNPDDINIIIITHKHWDHNRNNNLFENAKVFDFKNIDNLPLKQFKIFKVPGHSKDSLAFLYNGILFSGDTLFHNGIGRTDLPESEPEKMEESLNKLKSLDYKILCPGHI